MVSSVRKPLQPARTARRPLESPSTKCSLYHLRYIGDMKEAGRTRKARLNRLTRPRASAAMQSAELRRLLRLRAVLPRAVVSGVDRSFVDSLNEASKLIAGADLHRILPWRLS